MPGVHQPRVIGKSSPCNRIDTECPSKIGPEYYSIIGTKDQPKIVTGGKPKK